MLDLERAARDMVEHPVVAPTPTSVLRDRAWQYVYRRQRRATRGAVVLGVVLLIASIGLIRQADVFGGSGGASKASTACPTCSATTTSSAEFTSTTAGSISDAPATVPEATSTPPTTSPDTSEDNSWVSGLLVAFALALAVLF